MVKALSFKGDAKSKKRKRTEASSSTADNATSTDLVDQHSAVPEDDTTWVSADAVTDISGPVILVLPTKSPTCLASDAIGKVFASEVENMVEDEPSTAEPHDVRQVWIANRVAGSEGFSFKGHHGKYLGVDKFGIPSATRDAVSAEESFICLSTSDDPPPHPDVETSEDTGRPPPTAAYPASTFHLQTTRKTYLSTDEESKPGVQVRGDAAEVSGSTVVRIRMQARFKPKLKADKVEKAREKISRSQLESEVGRRLEDDEVKKLKRARKEGTYYEAMLDVKVKGKHDKYA